MKDWLGGKWSSRAAGAGVIVALFSVAVAVGCFVSWHVGGKSRRRSADVGFVTWNSLRRN